MPSLTIRNLPADVHEALVRRARENRRSLNQEILSLLSREAAAPRVDAGAWIRETTEMHRSLGIRPIPGLERILRGKREGLK